MWTRFAVIVQEVLVCASPLASRNVPHKKRNRAVPDTKLYVKMVRVAPPGVLVLLHLVLVMGYVVEYMLSTQSAQQMCFVSFHILHFEKWKADESITLSFLQVHELETKWVVQALLLISPLSFPRHTVAFVIYSAAVVMNRSTEVWPCRLAQVQSVSSRRVFISKQSNSSARFSCNNLLGSGRNECFHSYSGNPIIIQGSRSSWKPRMVHGVKPSLTHPRTLGISVKIQLP